MAKGLDLEEIQNCRKLSICENCFENRLKCPICGYWHIPEESETIIPDDVYVCHVCYIEFFEGKYNQLYTFPHSYEYFEKRGVSEYAFENYLKQCNEVQSILHTYSVLDFGQQKQNIKLFRKILRNRIINIAVINGIEQEYIDTKVDTFPIYHWSLLITCMGERRGRFGVNICTVTPSMFRYQMEAHMEYLSKFGTWSILRFDKERNPFHCISRSMYEEARRKLVGIYFSEPIRPFNSYEEMAEYYTTLQYSDSYEQLKESDSFDLSDLLDDRLYDLFDKTEKTRELESQICKLKRVLFVCNVRIHCEIDKHEIRSVRLRIPTLNSGSVEINANYCEDCDLLFIYRNDYDRIKNEYGLPLIKFAMHDQSTMKNKVEQDQSILYLSGYNVNSDLNLSSDQRRTILSTVVANKSLSKAQIIAYLNWFIDHNGRIFGHEKAAIKWKDDLAFVNSIDFDKQVQMVADIIKKYEGK